jgi:hypothetical protein
MDHETRHVKRSCVSPPPTSRSVRSAKQQDPAPAESADRGHRPPEMTGTLWKFALTTATPAAAAGPFCWYFTRSPAASLGVMIILAFVTLGAACLIAREETSRVKAREQGATDRERIRYQDANVLAETQRSLIMTATCGPSSSASDALALRLDARKALEMWSPTSMADAMLIARLQELDDHCQSRPGQSGGPGHKDAPANSNLYDNPR